MRPDACRRGGTRRLGGRRSARWPESAQEGRGRRSSGEPGKRQVSVRTSETGSAWGSVPAPRIRCGPPQGRRQRSGRMPACAGRTRFRGKLRHISRGRSSTAEGSTGGLHGRDQYPASGSTRSQPTAARRRRARGHQRALVAHIRRHRVTVWVTMFCAWPSTSTSACSFGWTCPMCVKRFSRVPWRFVGPWVLTWRMLT
jgi:hypothetical protein